eukprot:9151585-Alexandrium_andersonii.AAC.1
MSDDLALQTEAVHRRVLEDDRSKTTLAPAPTMGCIDPGRGLHRHRTPPLQVRLKGVAPRPLVDSPPSCTASRTL